MNICIKICRGVQLNAPARKVCSLLLFSILLLLLSHGIVQSQSQSQSQSTSASASEIDKSKPYQLEEILVTPGRFTIADRARSINVLPKSEVGKFPLIDNDIYRAMQIFPGVVGSDFSARFQIRGGEKDETIVRLDGMELYDPYHLQDFGGAVSNIDLGVINRAELLSGGFGAEYGDKMSGVFEIFSREANRQKIKGDFGLDLINADLLLELPLSKNGSWLIAARRGYIDLIIDLIAAISGSEVGFKPAYADIYSKTVYDITPKDKLSLNLLYADDSNQLDEEGEENDLKSHYTNGILWTKWQHRLGNKAFSELFTFGGLASRDRKDGIDGLDKRDLSYFGSKAEFSYKPIASHTLKSGLQWRWSQGDYAYSENSAKVNKQETGNRKQETGKELLNRLQSSPQGWDSWAYLQDNWQLSKHLAAELGARYIYQNYREGNSKSDIGPRVAFAAKARENLLFRAAWGIYFQPLTPLELPIQRGLTELVDPERATHYILGCEYSPTAKFFLRAESYYKKLDDLKGLAQVYDYGQKAQFFTAPSSGTAKGLELFGRMLLSNKAVGYLGYAYSIAKEKSKEGSLEFEYPRDSDQRHSFVINFNYVFSPTFNLNLGWRFHTGRPYTDAQYVRTEAEASGWRKVFGETNAKRFAPYHSFDLRLSRSHDFKRWNLNWYLQILNLYSRKNIHEYALESEKYEAGELKGQIKRDEQGRVLRYLKKPEYLFPILPTLGMSGSF